MSDGTLATGDFGNRLPRCITFRPPSADETPSAQASPPGLDQSTSQQEPPATIDPGALDDEEIRSRLRLCCDVSGDPVTFMVSSFLDWPSGDRLRFFRYLHGLPQPCQLRGDGQDTTFTDPFEFVLGQMVGDSNINRCEQGRRAAVQAAAIFHPDAEGPAASRIATRLRELGLRNVRSHSVLAEVQRAIEELRTAPVAVSPVRLRDLFHSAPVTNAAVVPHGWELSWNGIVRQGHNVQHVASVPICIIARLVDPEGGESFVLSFFRDGNWARRVVSRSRIASKGAILALADRGLPVTAANASQLVSYLHSYETQNYAAIPVAHTTDHLGWHPGDSTDGFMWGRDYLRPGAENIAVDLERGSPEFWPTNALFFRGLSDGERHLADGFHSRGSFAEWCDVVAAIAPFPRLRFIFYAALTPPLLSILGASNFCVDLCGPSSRGKTTGLRLAAACWGCPDERSPCSVVTTWDSTRAFRERLSVVLRNLPLIIDDTSLRDRDDDTVRMIYSLVSGRSRGRGRGSGLGSSGTWASVLLTSGECPLVSLSNLGGIRARTFSLWGGPFGATNGNIARIARQLNTGVAEQYGFAGPALVNYLLDHRGDHEGLRQEFRQLRREYEERAADNPVASRMADPLAALTTTARVAHRAMQLPWPYSDPVLPLWDQLTAESNNADRAAAALEFTVDWARGRQHSFFGRSRDPNRPPLGGWAGRWDVEADWLGFRPGTLQAVLRAGNFEFDATIRTWADRGWILRDNSSGKYRHRARLGNEPAWLIAIRREAIRSVEGDSESTDEGQDESNGLPVQASPDAGSQHLSPLSQPPPMSAANDTIQHT